jgi:hypothetical protein
LTASVSKAPPAPQEGWSPLDPANVSPFVAYLATEDCPINGRIFFVMGGEVHLFQPWSIVESLKKEGTWTIEELAKEGQKLQEHEFDYGHPLGAMLFQS